MSEIGKLLRELRGSESLREASKRIGISHTYLDTIEKGYDKRSGKEVNPSPDTLRLISKAYSYPYKKLLILAGYIEDNNEDIPESNSLTEINKLLKKYGIDQSGFFDIEKWKNLGPEEIRQLERYFQFIVEESRKRDSLKND